MSLRDYMIRRNSRFYYLANGCGERRAETIFDRINNQLSVKVELSGSIWFTDLKQTPINLIPAAVDRVLIMGERAS